MEKKGGRVWEHWNLLQTALAVTSVTQTCKRKHDFTLEKGEE